MTITSSCKCGCGEQVHARRVFVNKHHQLHWMVNGGAKELNARQSLVAKIRGGTTAGRKAARSGRLLAASMLGGAASRRIASEFRTPPKPDELAGDLVEVQERVRTALDLLYQTDGGLLVRDVAERTIASRLAVHLTKVFPGRDIDVEYNRHSLDPKTVDLPPECGGVEKRIFPDVVVHRRGDDKANLLVVELKKSTNSEPRICDRAKVIAIKSQLNYSHGVFIELPAGTDATLCPPLEEWL